MKRPWPFARHERTEILHPEEWSGPTGKPKVLIENPDGADLWAHAEILREAGYEVAVCGGPRQLEERVTWLRRRPGPLADPGELEVHEAETRCPLVAHGHCPLVEDADVVVSTTSLADGREILATISSRGSPPLVVEGTRAALERDRDVIEGAAVVIEEPVTERRLLTAVEKALRG
jgi:hypothetical protein